MLSLAPGSSAGLLARFHLDHGDLASSCVPRCDIPSPQAVRDGVQYDLTLWHAFKPFQFFQLSSQANIQPRNAHEFVLCEQAKREPFVVQQSPGHPIAYGSQSISDPTGSPLSLCHLLLSCLSPMNTTCGCTTIDEPSNSSPKLVSIAIELPPGILDREQTLEQLNLDD